MAGSGPRASEQAALVVAGPLGLLPLHASRWDEADRVCYLAEELDIVYAPSVWVLRRCFERQRRSWSPVLGVTNPQKNVPRRNLPFCEWEAQEIAKLVAGGGGAFRGDLLGPSATVKDVSAALPGHPVAHFACHGLWQFQNPLESCLELADGRLTLAELLRRVRLVDGRLVVLSACESGPGFGPQSTGEEYLGLPAGFILAGAKTVVGSLWTVPDWPTALLMTQLYEGLVQGMTVLGAPGAAQNGCAASIARQRND